MKNSLRFNSAAILCYFLYAGNIVSACVSDSSSGGKGTTGSSPETCNFSCLNGGTCNDGKCSCQPGWTHYDCAEPSCTAVTCNGNQYCSAPDVCSCLTGWTGGTCQIAICTPACGPGKTCQKPNVCEISCDSAQHKVLGNQGSCVCDSFNHYVESSSGDCVCDSSNHWTGGSGTMCVCDSSTHWIMSGSGMDAVCTCDSSNHYITSGSGPTAQCICDSSNHWSGTGTCSCDSVAHWVVSGAGASAICICDSSNHFATSGTGATAACICDSSNHWTGSASCSCIAADHWVISGTGASSSCVCDTSNQYSMTGSGPTATCVPVQQQCTFQNVTLTGNTALRSNAVAACAALGRTLAIIRTAADKSAATTVTIVKNIPYVHIGLTRPTVASPWVWDDGTPLQASPTYWHSGQPATTSTHLCAQLSFYSYWYSNDCNTNVIGSYTMAALCC